MRIISGKRRGLRLADIGKGDLAAHLRPTTDRVRESIFNVLMGGAYGDPVSNSRVLDLFAGTGAMGLEAWSRGAAKVTLVDGGETAQTLMRKNIKLCQSGDNVNICRRNATRMGKCSSEPYNLIFLDPPYGNGLGEKALKSLQKGGWIAVDALIVHEEMQATEPSGFTSIDERRYGNTHVTILQSDPFHTQTTQT